VLGALLAILTAEDSFREFESLDFSKIDMSEYYAELQKIGSKIDGAQKKIEDTILLRTEQIRQH